MECKGQEECTFYIRSVEKQELGVDPRHAIPESSGRCRSLRSTGTCSHSQDAGSGNCLLCRRRRLCSLLLTRPHRGRWSFCHRPGRSLRTTARGGQRTPADPPEDVNCKESCEHILALCINSGYNCFAYVPLLVNICLGVLSPTQLLSTQ